MKIDTPSSSAALRELMQGKGMLGFDPAALSGRFCGFGAKPDEGGGEDATDVAAAPEGNSPTNADVTVEKPEDAA